MKRATILGWACLLILVSAAQANATETSSAVFDKLKTLAGEWDTKMPDGSATRVTYRLTSAGSVLVETIFPGGPMEMVTLYHPDGASVVATHYCASQNQPRMRAKAVSGEIKEIAFEFLDVTNLASPEAGHMREVHMTFQDNDHFTATWISREKGKDTPMVFNYTRVK